MTRPYYVADRRERDMVEFEPVGVEVAEHDSLDDRVAFWLEWDRVGGWNFTRRPAASEPALSPDRLSPGTGPAL